MRPKATTTRLAMIAFASAGLLAAPAALAGSFGGGAVTVNEGVLNALGTGQPPVASNYGAYSAGSVAVAPTTAIGAPRGAGSASVSPYQVFPTQEGSVVLPSYPLLFPPRDNPRSVVVSPQGSPAPARMSSPAQVPSSSSLSSQQQPESQFIAPKPKVASTPALAPTSSSGSTAMASSTPPPAPAPTPAPATKTSDSMTEVSSSQPPEPVTLPAKPPVKKTMEEPVQTVARPEMKAPEEDPAGNSMTAEASSSQTPPPPPTVTPAPSDSGSTEMAKAPEPPAAPKMEDKPEPKTEAKPAEPFQTAAVSATAPVDDNFATLLFAPGDEALTDDMKTSLNKIIGDMKADKDMRIQLLSYAGGENLSVNQARRLSLKRALAVRRYLLDQDIRANRMDVRALGKAVDGGSLDRVDVKAARR
ncbi:OmpA family protein [Rhodovibrionaceae bacterium A322]